MVPTRALRTGLAVAGNGDVHRHGDGHQRSSARSLTPLQLVERAQAAPLRRCQVALGELEHVALAALRVPPRRSTRPGAVSALLDERPDFVLSRAADPPRRLGDLPDEQLLDGSDGFEVSSEGIQHLVEFLGAFVGQERVPV